MGEVKESKAQRAERLKRELNPWEAYDTIVRFAREGHASIPPEWATYFRWWGIYSQGDGAGAVGGVGGEGKATPYFMIRIRIPNGILASQQLRTIAELTQRHARGIADVTVRQNIQLHWVTIEDLPSLMQALWRAGLTSLGACGDVTRNVTGCPLAGMDREAVIDASPLVLAATRLLNGNAEFYNLPRKYRSRSAAAGRGARIPRSTTSVSRRSNIRRRGRPASRCASAAVSPPIRISASASTPSCAGTRWYRSCAR